MTKRDCARDVKGVTGTDTASSRYINEKDCSTTEGLSLRAKEVEREYRDVIERFLVPYARECVSTGRRFSVHERLDWLRWHGAASVNHDAQPILARIVLDRVPEARGLVETRKSKWDEVFSERAAYAEETQTAS